MSKSEQITVKRPKWILQVFVMETNYGKNVKSFESRKEVSQWPGKIVSEAGMYDSKTAPATLHLSSDTTFLDVELSDLILIEDRVQYEQAASIQFTLNQKQTATYGIFKLMKAGDFNTSGKLEVHLSETEYTLGQPARDQFKVAELVPNGQVLEIKINGKSDFSWSGRKERAYRELSFRFQMFPAVQLLEIHRTPIPTWEKIIPHPDKTVDLMKTLY